MKLVIVESPAKAKTISRFLGNEYDVVASYGHVRDLPSSADEIPESLKGKPWARMAVDVDDNFRPVYVVQRDSKKHLADLRKRLKSADTLVLATDEDREGEAISWHLLEELKPKVPVERIVFHEITRTAIQEAIAHPRGVNNELVRAQESRRILDRLYGYSLSPVLWRKVRTKLSAGRVQSVAVRLVVEREEERRAFRTAEYWDVVAKLSANGREFEATLVSLDGKRVAAGRDFDAATGMLSAEAEASQGGVVWLRELDAVRAQKALEQSLPWTIAAIEQKETKQRPYPPFTTSTLQQAASSQLGMSPRQTMQVAQRLYEGVDLGGGEREGLITYMRTDSVVLSAKALADAEHVIRERYGDAYAHRRQFATKSKMAQEAHEAIRPTLLHRNPDSLAPYLAADEGKLYRLIYARTLASQMADAIILRTALEFAAPLETGEAILRANGSVVKFDGFLRVLGRDQQDSDLPDVQQGERVGDGERIGLAGIEPQRHETKPPARFNEATLVKRLEEEGIGRPSTYAPTVSVIQQRGYVYRIGKALAPSYLGIAVTLLLRQHFAEYVDLKFTARMEGALDDIASGEQDWIAFLEGFYRGQGNFGEGLQPKIEHEIERIDFPAIPVGEDAEGRTMLVKLGRTAPYLLRGDGGAGNTAPVPEDLPYDQLSVDKAIELFEAKARGNEALGTDPETGMPVYVLLGPYGPYAQLGEAVEGSAKPKRASLPRGTDMAAVTLEEALKHLSLPRTLGTHPEHGKVVKAGVGRFGPYVVCDGDYRSIKPIEHVFTIDLAEAIALLAQPKQRRGAAKTKLREVGAHPESGVLLEIFDGKYGAYVSDGKKNATVPKGKAVESLTVAEAVALLAEVAEKKGSRTKKAAAKKPAAKRVAAKSKAAPKKKAATRKTKTPKKDAGE